jgi:threonylcarbamoyladenosine tRNA methylthiotransferase MtaB
LKDEIIEFVSTSKRFVPHFHIPLQSGSDFILGKMKRRYRTDLYRNRIEKINQLMPNACIGVDVIVGFPGETDSLFEETYQFLNELNISYLHVFTFSERPNTPAFEMSNKTANLVKNQRNKRLRILSSKKLLAFYHRHIGKTYKALFESENRGGKIYGYTENYIRVSADFYEDLKNEIVQVKIKEINKNGEAECEILQNEMIKL